MLLVKNMLCRDSRRQKGLNLIIFSYDIGQDMSFDGVLKFVNELSGQLDHLEVPPFYVSYFRAQS